VPGEHDGGSITRPGQVQQQVGPPGRHLDEARREPPAFGAAREDLPNGLLVAGRVDAASADQVAQEIDDLLLVGRRERVVEWHAQG
jgi:hypothetical protein